MNRLDFIVPVLIVVAFLPASNSAAAVSAQKPTSIADKIEPINPQKPPQQQLQQLQQQQQELSPNRSPFLDSLFNIPIQTLRAVNELVQGIAGTLASSQRRPPLPQRFQQQQRQFVHDMNLNGI